MGHVDDGAVRLIVTGCRQVRPDATEDEIVHFIGVNAQRFRKMPSVENPMGMLIRYLPKCFEGESFERYREAERQRREAEAAEQAAFEAEQHRILEDPNTSEEEKEWARRMLS